MFPLGSVLLPGGLLPLHVFEPRYRDMIRDCLRSDDEPEFGQVLITHGWETGGGDDRALVGTVARMMQVENGIPLPAGETVMLERGGLHVMFMGLNGPFEEGAAVDVTLVFENAGEIDVAIPVDLRRGPTE